MTSVLDDYPRICHETGLDCETCTAATARQLVQCCQGLRGGMVGQLFVQIHPHPACARMHSHFAAVYREASTVWPNGMPERRPAVMAAVA